MTHLLICKTCLDAKNEANSRSIDAETIAQLQDHLDQSDLSERIIIQPSPCLGVCTDAHAIALTGKGRASLVFCGVDPVKDMADIAATCRAWLEAEDGWIEDARPCGRLRHQLHARIPYLDESVLG